MPFTWRPGDAGLGERAADGLDGGVPPVLGALLGPQRALHAHVFVRRGAARADGAALIHQQRARAAGADIDAQPHRTHRGIIQVGSSMPASFPVIPKFVPRWIPISSRRRCGTARIAPE